MILRKAGGRMSDILKVSENWNWALSYRVFILWVALMTRIDNEVFLLCPCKAKTAQNKLRRHCNCGVPTDQVVSLPTTTMSDYDPYELRAKYTRFRILVIGRANAGKTTLLQRVCNTTEDPCIYDDNNKNLVSVYRTEGILVLTFQLAWAYLSGNLLTIGIY